jgi:hypothetical protein
MTVPVSGASPAGPAGSLVRLALLAPVPPTRPRQPPGVGEPSVERWFTAAFANQEDVSADSAAASVAYLASGAADVLSGRNVDVSGDMAQMVARAAEIEEHDLYVLREHQ